MEPDLKAAYGRLEQAIHDVSACEGTEGVMTEWVVLTSHQKFDDDGDGVTEYGILLPEGGGQTPHHRVMGLLDLQLTRMRAQAAED